MGKTENIERQAMAIMLASGWRPDREWLRHEWAQSYHMVDGLPSLLEAIAERLERKTVVGHRLDDATHCLSARTDTDDETLVEFRLAGPRRVLSYSEAYKTDVLAFLSADDVADHFVAQIPWSAREHCDRNAVTP